MKGSTETYISLNEIVNEALLDLGFSSHYKEQFLSWGLRYYKKLRMDVLREVRTIQLTMTPWKSVVLPDDAVDWIMIGIKDGEMLKTFVNDPKLSPRASAADNGAPVAPTFNNVDVSGEGVQWFNCSDLGEDPGKLYGMLIKDNGLGYFTPNFHEGVNEIQLSAQVPAGTTIYLMYLSNLFDPNRDTIIHPYAQPSINLGIHYESLKHKRYAGDRRISNDMVSMAKKELDDELCLLAERRWDLSTETIVESIRAAYRLSPKH